MKDLILCVIFVAMLPVIWLREAEDPRTVMTGFLYSLFAELGGKNSSTSTVTYRITPISGALENGDWSKEGFNLNSDMYYAESERRKRVREEDDAKRLKRIKELEDKKNAAK